MKALMLTYSLSLLVALLLLTKCTDETSNETQELEFESSSISLKMNGRASIDIIGGTGDYSIYSSAPGIVTARMENQTIVITGLSVGEALLKVKDKNTTDEINVTVFD